ncbi:MAG TPA: ABC transporter permease [Vicinamibacterales bacterium]|nr:ABC transporter permease [Vicinamibacterales bacterium]
MPTGLLRFLLRRVASALVLVFVVSSSALVLLRLAPGDAISGFDVDPVQAARERERLGLDRPLLAQYASWLGRAVRLDFGESLKYRRPVGDLVRDRALNTLVLGVAALALATLLGVPAGVLTATRHGVIRAAARGISLLLLSLPPLVTSFGLLIVAASTGWLPVGGFGIVGGWSDATAVRYLILPALALALPLAASIERLQSQAMTRALEEPCVHAARARGCSPERAIWRHAFPLSLGPVISIYGVMVGTVLSGSFAVELVTSWPGLGALMYEALVARDLYLAAGCATVGAALLAAGVFLADVALALLDPRVAGTA